MIAFFDSLWCTTRIKTKMSDADEDPAELDATQFSGSLRDGVALRSPPGVEPPYSGVLLLFGCLTVSIVVLFVFLVFVFIYFYLSFNFIFYFVHSFLFLFFFFFFF